ncbi:hypothetical protein [Microcella sp.]|uniref:hypothetical protein n=1 Tax=Microcella sp. TaxID=1913979 RepID=UPI00256558AA|nr:hypothetical protein [Microcella sp.]MBX9470639.1 hypothetical protein [Microcella sp.]
MTSPHDQPLSRRAARRALEAERAGVETFAQPPGDGRTASGRSGATPASVPSSAPTDMTYRTQVRPRVPHYDERTVPAMPTIETPAPIHQAPPPVAPPALSEHGAERVRRRDFRPPAVSDEAPASVESPTFDTPLEYHTQLSHRPVVPPAVVDPPVPPAHVITVPETEQPATADRPVEVTLSRRELRELRAAQAPAVVPAPAESPPPAAETPTLVEPVRQAPVDPAPVHHAPVLNEPLHVEPELVQPPVVRPTPVVPTSTGSHWSTGIHDDEDPFENTFSREVGSATSLNTNALVLPEMPTGSIAGPVAGTGEIIITGMITVSPMHASTGTVPTLHDSPDLDDLFDADDREVSAPDSAPVSALKAISSHTATHTVMTGKPSTSNTVTTVLVASTVGMAVIAIGLFVVAAANGLF